MAEDRITSALRGGPLPVVPGLQNDTGDQTEQGDGTQASGYVTPDLGPFECENCIHFDGQSRCNHPQVISDPEVNGQVEAESCCNFFKSAHNETQAEEHGEGDLDALHESS
jgi:hypothetical protein